MNANPLEAQAHVMHHTNAVRDSIHDLYEWEKEIKELEKQRKVESEKKSHQPVRSHGKSANDDEIIKSPAHVQADKLKEEGNVFVKKNDFKKAIHFYTEAIRTYKFDPVYFTNRALCYLKLKQNIDCIEDCSIAIQLDPVCLKAYYRRMQANECLSNIDDALSDCRKVLQLDANNKDAKRTETTLREKRQKMAKSRSLPKKKQDKQPNFTKVAKTLDRPAPWSKFEEPGDIRIDFFDRPPHLRPKDSLHRIDIRDVEQFEDKPAEEAKIEEIKADKSSIEVMSPMISLLENNNNVQIKDINGKEDLTAAADPSKSEITKREAAEKSVNNEKEKLKSESKSAEQNRTKSPFTVKERSAMSIVAPRTTTEFHMAWASLPADEDRYLLLKTIAGKDVNKLLGAQFTSTMLSEILVILNQRFVNDKVAIGNILKGIVSNSQMNIFAFMMSDEEKLVFAQLITFMRSIGEDEDLAHYIEQRFDSLLS